VLGRLRSEGQVGSTTTTKTKTKTKTKKTKEKIFFFQQHTISVSN
jgi:hypothetical protein